jgi:hypothetical protein
MSSRSSHRRVGVVVHSYVTVVVLVYVSCVLAAKDIEASPGSPRVHIAGLLSNLICTSWLFASIHSNFEILW